MANYTMMGDPTANRRIKMPNSQDIKEDPRDKDDRQRRF